MTPEPLFCPYCNSRVPVPPFREGGQRVVVCPRCGETFPYRPRPTDADAGPVPSPPTAAGADAGNRSEPLSEPAAHLREVVPQPEPGRRWTNRAVALLVLGGMGMMAVLGLVYALLTQDVRRSHDVAKPPPAPVSVPFVLRFALGVYVIALVFAVVRGLVRRGRPAPETDEAPTLARRLSVPIIALIGLILVVMIILTSRDTPHQPAPPPETVRIVAPAELAALGYLPDNANVVVGVHVAEALREGPGKQFAEWLWLLASLQGAGQIETRTGLPFKDFDHVVLGLSRAKGGEQLTVVARTRQPYNMRTVRKALGSSARFHHGDRAAFSLAWDQRHQAVLWCAEPDTLVLVFQLDGGKLKDLATIPIRPRTGSLRLPAPLQPLFKERPLSSGTPIWMAGHLPTSAQVRQLLALLPLPRLDRQTLARIQNFQVGLRLDQEVTLSAEFQGPNAPAAQELEKYLGRQVQALRRWVPGLAVKLHRAPSDNWVLLQVKTDRQALLNARAGSGKRK